MATGDRPAHGPGVAGGVPEGTVAPEAVGGAAPTPEERRLALRQVLTSVAFERADQLRNFLSYVCEKELEGRGCELNEHLIGVEALGRPAHYSTNDDSSVRRCAHALRQKLEEAYSGELAGAKVRIELPRGGYQPRFHHAVITQGGHARTASSRASWRARSLWLMVAFVLGAAAGAVGHKLWPVAAAPKVDPVLFAAWGPLASSGANPLICLSAPAHYGILPYPDGPLPPKVTFLPESPELVAWWQRHYPLVPGHRLASHLTSGPVRLGEVFGLVAALRTLWSMGVSPEVVAEKHAMLPALQGRNVLLFGNPEYSHAALALLERTPLTMAYDPTSRDRVVRSAAGAEPRLFKPRRDERGTLSDALGLITVLPSQGVSERTSRRTIIVSCTNAAGCQAAVEFFSSPVSLRTFQQRLAAEGRRGFPNAYQVVIRTQVFLSSQSISGAYEAHVVIQP